MMMVITIISLLLLSIHINLIENISIEYKNNLTKKDCTYNDGRFGNIDLSRVGLKQGIPAFRHVPKDFYFYSCFFLLVEKNGSAYYNLGMNSIVSWSITIDGKVTLVYSVLNRQTIVNLECRDEIDELVINGEYEPRHYNLTLFSKCACWNGC
ncbi:unnamed protein product [Adineta steineri]|uniref:Uncharacterized protein n=1 Tax=Adineta steineri TaxID=433720 RepID=A0A813Z303_9BILA|nr:unnamed protein product [Adineta steineri]CAF0892795.1 unnamed protein product [Adineta steineri]